MLGKAPPRPPAPSAPKPLRPGPAATPAAAAAAAGAEEEEEEDFRDLRREARGRALPPKPPGRQRGLAASLPQRSDEEMRLNVDPSYFSYAAGRKAQAAARTEAHGAQGAQQGADASLGEMVMFLEMHELSGPVRAYARAFALQGVKDPATLLGLSEGRLGVVVARAEVDATDEILLREALNTFR